MIWTVSKWPSWASLCEHPLVFKACRCLTAAEPDIACQNRSPTDYRWLPKGCRPTPVDRILYCPRDNPLTDDVNASSDLQKRVFETIQLLIATSRILQSDALSGFWFESYAQLLVSVKSEPWWRQSTSSSTPRPPLRDHDDALTMPRIWFRTANRYWFSQPHL